MKKDWTYKKLGEICESDLGKTLNSKTDTGEYRPYLCAINVLWDKIDMSTLKTTKFETSELERYSVKKGDLLVCEGGDIGRAAIWNEDEPMQYQNALHRIRFNGDMLPRFFLMYLHNLKNTGVLDNNYGKGVTIKHLVKTSLLSIPVPVPPLSEQQHIVSELDLLQSIIDKQQAQLKEYDNLAQAIFYDMFGDPVDNERNWDVKKLGEICSSELGKMLDAKKNTGTYRDYLCTINVLWGGFDFTTVKQMKIEEKDIERYSVRKGDLLICEGGDTGRCAIWKNDNAICYQNSLHRVRLFPNTLLPITCQFVFMIMKKQGEIDKYSKGQTIKHLVKNVLLSIPVPIPPIALQQSFAAKIESIEKQKAAINKSIEETQKLFDYTMDKYFG